MMRAGACANVEHCAFPPASRYAGILGGCQTLHAFQTALWPLPAEPAMHPASGEYHCSRVGQMSGLLHAGLVVERVLSG